MSTWTEVAKELPPDGRIVMTKIDNAQGCRNEQPLKLRGRFWYFPDDYMYVYYAPTHWRPLDAAEKTVLLKRLETSHQAAVAHIQESLAELKEGK